MSGRQGKVDCNSIFLSCHLRCVGGKKKPLKQPKKQQDDLDEVMQTELIAVLS